MLETLKRIWKWEFVKVLRLSCEHPKLSNWLTQFKCLTTPVREERITQPGKKVELFSTSVNPQIFKSGIARGRDRHVIKQHTTSGLVCIISVTQRRRIIYAFRDNFGKKKWFVDLELPMYLCGFLVQILSVMLNISVVSNLLDFSWLDTHLE